MPSAGSTTGSCPSPCSSATTSQPRHSSGRPCPSCIAERCQTCCARPSAITPTLGSPTDLTSVRALPHVVCNAATTRPPRRSQADRRAETHAALLSSAARALSRFGYNNLNLADVAAEAGYTRGALYHLFADKEDLALAVVAWDWGNWQQQVGSLIDPHGEPFQTLVALARRHIAYCRDGRARVMMTLRIEFAEREHPVGQAVSEIAGSLRTRIEHLIVAGRRSGTIPPGPRPGSWRRHIYRRSTV